jgi:HAD superfamily hydrolase (TIGR01509 family)
LAQAQQLTFEASSQVNAALDGVELVIFDFDGVIADSEVLSLDTLRYALADWGLQMPLEQVRSLFLGKSLASISDYIACNCAPNMSEGFADHWQNNLFKQLRTKLKPMTAVLPFLEILNKRGVEYCIASSSSFDRLELSLAAIRLEAQFPNLFSAEQVQNGKPAPDLFQFTAKHMNKAPSACLVIEDSPYGVEGATAAGMRVFGFVAGTHLNDIQNVHAQLLLNAGAERVLRVFAEL